MKVSSDLLIVLGFAVFGLVGWLSWRSNISRPSHESRFRVELDDAELRVTDPKGGMQRLKRAELDQVVIETNDSGPVGADFWWILTARDGTVVPVPIGATGEQALIDWVIGLDGFDHEQWTAAVRSTRNASFPCWRAAER